MSPCADAKKLLCRIFWRDKNKFSLGQKGNKIVLRNKKIVWISMENSLLNFGEWNSSVEGAADGEELQAMNNHSAQWKTNDQNVAFSTTSSLSPANGSNTTITLELPIDMQFNSGHVVSICVYSVLFILSTVGKIRKKYVMMILSITLSMFQFKKMVFK